MLTPEAVAPSPISGLPVLTTHSFREWGVQELCFLLHSWKDPGAETAVLLLITLYFSLLTDSGRPPLLSLRGFLTTGVNVGIKRCCNRVAEKSTIFLG